MLYFSPETLAARETDRLRTAARCRLLAKVRGEQAARAAKRRRGLRWHVFRVSPTTGSAS